MYPSMMDQLQCSKAVLFSCIAYVLTAIVCTVFVVEWCVGVYSRVVASHLQWALAAVVVWVG